MKAALLLFVCLSLVYIVHSASPIWETGERFGSTCVNRCKSKREALNVDRTPEPLALQVIKRAYIAYACEHECVEQSDKTKRQRLNMDMEESCEYRCGGDDYIIPEGFYTCIHECKKRRMRYEERLEERLRYEEAKNNKRHMDKEEIERRAQKAKFLSDCKKECTKQLGDSATLSQIGSNALERCHTTCDEKKAKRQTLNIDEAMENNKREVLDMEDLGENKRKARGTKLEKCSVDCYNNYGKTALAISTDKFNRCNKQCREQYGQ